MKRIAAAVLFAVIAIPALAAELPFEQTELDRALPNISERAVTSSLDAPAFVQYDAI